MLPKHELEQLERKERELWNELHFHRESPRELRGIPFVSEYDHMPYPRLARALYRLRGLVRRVFKV
jgi:hypothetical protein